MAYVRTGWQDHAVERPRTYTEVTNPDGSKTFTPAPGEVVQQGTPLSAANLNHMEDGIAAAAEKVLGAEAGNFAGLDADGNLIDSLKKATDFATSGHLQAIAGGGTGATDAANAIKNLMFLGIDPDFVDTPLNWVQKGLCWAWYQTAVVSSITNKPVQYGFLINIPLPGSGEVHQLFIAQANAATGAIYHRGGNNSVGWFTSGWKTVYDSANVITDNTATLLNGFTGWIKYSKLAFGPVIVRIQITPGTLTAFTSIAQLPTGYRPGTIVPILFRDSGASGTIKNAFLSTDGTIKNTDALTSGATYTATFTFLAE